MVVGSAAKGVDLRLHDEEVVALYATGLQLSSGE